MQNTDKTGTRFPPGGRGWPVVGHGMSWYNAVAGPHPPRFVEEQVKRYVEKAYICLNCL